MAEKIENKKPFWVYVVAGIAVLSFIGGAFMANPSLASSLASGTPTYTPVTRHYTLVVEGADIQEGPNAVWHAWTYNGTVPGPTLYAKVGDTLIVTVYNKLDLVHSFHTHLVNYNFSSDGSQANVIVGMGAGSMIAPGQSYTYYLNATYAGVFFYHCRSSDKFPISYHMAQGLYGIILVDDPKKPPPKLSHDFLVTMGEMGPDVTGTGAPPYIMDGIGFPGGEQALMNLYAAQGIGGVAAQFNKTLLTFEAKVGETIRINLINVGSLVHTFHLHDAELISEFQFPGVPYDDADVPLDPAVTDSVLVTLTQPGVFLFHCHVVPHADAGMIGVLVILPSNGTLTSAPMPTSPTYTLATSNSSALSLTSITSTTQSNPAVGKVSILLNSGVEGPGTGYSPSVIHVILGKNSTVMWTNNDNTIHTVTSNTGLFDSQTINAGQSWTYTFTKAGVYQYHCSYHSWMTGTVNVTAS